MIKIKQSKKEFEKLKGAKLKKIVFKDSVYTDEYLGDEFEFKLIFDNGLILDLDTTHYYPTIELWKDDVNVATGEGDKQ